MRKTSIFAVCLMLAGASTSALAITGNLTQVQQQKQSCRGVVKDTKGEMIIGATVQVKGTTNGTITGLDGDFSLSNVSNGDIILISYVGYDPVQVVWKGSNLNIVMKEGAQALSEVVVTGYGGKQSRMNVTNSIAKVKDETFKVGVFSNPAQALSGAVSGLRVMQTSGNPGAAPTVVLRGGTNLDGSGSPLVIVDGQLRGSLSDINPEDIESMDVMKDAGATAIYGARASNGVHNSSSVQKTISLINVKLMRMQLGQVQVV
jgi:TonB-dependent SusC/RagA subfamily outer membrane receptor